MVQVRINKYISDTGFCSRREAVPGTKVGEGDTVRIDGEILRPNPDSFVERPKLPKPKKRPVRFVPAEDEDLSAHRSHRGTRGGLRNKIGYDTEFSKGKNSRPRQVKNKKEDGHRSSRH